MMKSPTTEFITWFAVLQKEVARRTGVTFRDQDSVIDDYNDGKDVQEVIDDIVQEYGELT